MTVTERARALLSRIAAVDARLRCYVAVDEAQVLREAARLDAVEPGARGPLHGLSLAVKDLIDVAGLPTRAGSSFFRRDPQRDAPVVAALRAAGALVIGKTNTHEFAWGITTENPHFGRTANPWDDARTVGGSSGGSAAAVAAGLADIALGSDTLGSIRIPAALNGISGVRPATGALPLDDIFPLALGLDTVGPFAHDLATVRRTYDALAGSAVAAALTVTEREENAARAVVARARTGWNAATQGYDVALAPSVGSEAPRAPVPKTFRDETIPLVTPASAFGLPVAAVPIGFGPAGMPLGMQIVALDGAVATAFALGGAYQRLTGWHERRPQLSD
jgi:Asp-tRNA(Asn)/Glu-tRNA(Gln) amidotransferase A subunit family amidase